jgi:hypothetical protein
MIRGIALERWKNYLLVDKGLLKKENGADYILGINNKIMSSLRL